MSKTTQENRDLAGRYDTHVERIKRWRAAGAPLGDDAKMIEWAGGQRTLPPGFVKWLDAQQAPSQAPESNSAEDWGAFLARARKGAETAPHEALAQVRVARDIASARFMDAAKVKNRQDMRLYADLLSKFEGVLHDSEIRAKRLGMDSGELLARTEVERLIWAWGFWAMQSVNASLDGVTAKLAALAPGLGGEKVRAILDAELLSARFLTPFVRASEIKSGVSIPQWAVLKLKTTVGDWIENGEQQFDELTANRSLR